jgi:hypothetical protein
LYSRNCVLCSCLCCLVIWFSQFLTLNTSECYWILHVCCVRTQQQNNRPTRAHVHLLLTEEVHFINPTCSGTPTVPPSRVTGKILKTNNNRHP